MKDLYETVTKPIDDLIPYVNNSRTHSDEQVTQLAASIMEFGFTNPILIDEDNGVIAGHGRIMAAKKLDYKELPCVILTDLTEAQKKALVIADNQLALNAGWDLDVLKLELQTLDELDFGLDLLGFEDTFVDGLLNDPDEATGTEDDVPDLPVEAVSKAGDVWILGEHRLMCGDSTNLEAVEQLCGGQLVDMLMTDPPYNVAYEGKTKDSLTIENDEMGGADFRQFLVDAYTTADAVMKSGAVFYIWHADSEGYNFRGAAHDIGWQIRQCLIWKKNSMVMGRQDYHWQHEPCLYGWKAGASHLWAADRKQTTILEFDRPTRNDVHPTMKPVDLIEYQILNNTKGQDIVLDLFGGSGTTLIACEKSNRVARLMELDPIYCDVIVQRWQEYTGQRATLESTGQVFEALESNV